MAAPNVNRTKRNLNRATEKLNRTNQKNKQDLSVMMNGLMKALGNDGDGGDDGTGGDDDCGDCR